MSTLRDQARRVVSSLAAKPDLFYEVLALVEDEYAVAGPWVCPADVGGVLGAKATDIVDDPVWARYDPSGDCVAVVWQKGGYWYYWVENDHNADSEDAARIGADRALREAGWLLP